MNRTIRRLNLAEIQTLLDWAAAEGWNPGLDDALPFQAADPDGFLGAFVDQQMVAGISAVAYDDHFGYIGLYICHPDWRGQGHGKAVWDAAMAYLGDRTIGLDGVKEQQANYARMGFVPAHETIRMSGTLADKSAGDQMLAVGYLDDLRTLDRQCFPASRQAFLRHWLAPPRISLVHRTGGAIDGYAVSRSCRDGSKIGPLFATTIDAAADILATRSGLIHLDVPAEQTAWLQVLSRLGFVGGFTTRRMYRGKPPTLPMHRIFGVTSLELG
ncbi:GNAT family N-acetyltransferase [Devosia sp. SL43]|uniref:GNAT family N-acetyltransferase n=1 Tax=Devosia sp. SL43 TaxID=2806348 RepID=UPI001F0309CC|nr:GNAT family N-acetyltransferase [Devosia sp. SL43]UJW84000.1 GNAT family N-acetyltransferase [Devosia sp. SL43]